MFVCSALSIGSGSQPFFSAFFITLTLTGAELDNRCSVGRPIDRYDGTWTTPNFAYSSTQLKELWSRIKKLLLVIWCPPHRTLWNLCTRICGQRLSFEADSIWSPTAHRTSNPDFNSPQVICTVVYVSERLWQVLTWFSSSKWSHCVKSRLNVSSGISVIQTGPSYRYGHYWQF